MEQTPIQFRTEYQDADQLAGVIESATTMHELADLNYFNYDLIDCEQALKHLQREKMNELRIKKPLL